MTLRTEENRQWQTHNERAVIELGFTDQKRRRIGAQVCTWNAKMEPGLHDGKYGRSTLPPGPAFGLNCMATRNGAPYGAAQPSQWFATPEERTAAIEAYIAGAKKRAAKNPAFMAWPQ